MSESTGNTQPIGPIGGGTKPLKPIKPAPRWRSTLFSVAGVIALIGLGLFGGFQSGLSTRKQAKSAIISQQLAEQYQYTLVDMQFGRYEAAKQRLEFIILSDPSYPGAQDKYAEVLVLLTIPTPSPTPSLTPTPDLRGIESLFASAQQLITAQDWPNALAALDQLRKQDRTYKPSLVDGMYYFALRNYGMSLIIQQGNLEGGIYQLSLAERFGPLDRDANGLREGARAYIQAASFFGLDWKQAVFLFSQVAGGWPSLWDGTMTAAQRYQISLMRYGDELFAGNKFCDAYAQYQLAASISNLDQTAAKNANQSFQACYPPTGTPTATVPAAPSDMPTETPTDTDTPAP
jgi:tetratricopeptide (TPR) repeat protein